MEIQSIGRRPIVSAPQAARPEKDRLAAASAKEAERCDRYIPEEREKGQTAGLYKVCYGADGRPGIQWENPEGRPARTPEESPEMEASANAGPKGTPESRPAGQPEGEKPKTEDPKGSREGKTGSCTGSTDRVDREIKKLKEKKEQLQKRLRTASDPQETENLKQQLIQVENELRAKDNDTYRRQHMDISMS